MDVWLPGIQTPTLNVSMRQHLSKRGRATRPLARANRLAMGRQPLFVTPLQRACVAVERRSSGSRLPDYDGLVGVCKGLMVCLLSATERRKFGLGFALDDGPEHMQLAITAVRAARPDIGMRIIIITPLGSST